MSLNLENIQRWKFPKLSDLDVKKEDYISDLEKNSEIWKFPKPVFDKESRESSEGGGGGRRTSSVVLTEKGITQGETKVFVIDRALFAGIQFGK